MSSGFCGYFTEGFPATVYPGTVICRQGIPAQGVPCHEYPDIILCNIPGQSQIKSEFMR